MARTIPFDTHTEQYENWFEQNKAVYHSELQAIQAVWPVKERSLEIGVGTGRFAGPLGIGFGLDPSEAMLVHARKRGIHVVSGIAEKLPFADKTFDTILIVMTICYVDDVIATLRETNRVLKPGGSVIIGFLDRASKIGRAHLDQQAHKYFYTDARFFSAKEVDNLLQELGFDDLCRVQTLFCAPDAIKKIEPLKPGHGTGLFCVVRAKK